MCVCGCLNTLFCVSFTYTKSLHIFHNNIN